MIRRPPRSTRTDTRVPYTTLFRSPLAAALGIHQPRPAQDLQMPRGIGECQIGAGRQLLDAPLTLGKVLQQLEAMREIGRAPSELQSLMRISYAVFCLNKTTKE